MALDLEDDGFAVPVGSVKHDGERSRRDWRYRTAWTTALHAFGDDVARDAMVGSITLSVTESATRLDCLLFVLDASGARRIYVVDDEARYLKRNIVRSVPFVLDLDLLR